MANQEIPHNQYYFDSLAIDSLNQAQAEAFFMGTRNAGTEHLLLGIAVGAPDVLRRKDGTPITYEELLPLAMNDKSSPVWPIWIEDFSLTPSAKEAISISLDAAKRRGTPTISPRDLLIGIATMEDSVGAEILKEALGDEDLFSFRTRLRGPETSSDL